MAAKQMGAATFNKGGGNFGRIDTITVAGREFDVIEDLAGHGYFMTWKGDEPDDITTEALLAMLELHRDYFAVPTTGKWHRETHPNSTAPFWELDFTKEDEKSPSLVRAEEHARRQNPAPSTRIQTLIFDRDRFDEAQARAWAKNHGFDQLDVDEKTNTLRLRQRRPASFAQGTLRTIELTDGVQAVIGRPAHAEARANPEHSDTWWRKFLAMTKAQAQQEARAFPQEQEALLRAWERREKPRAARTVEVDPHPTQLARRAVDVDPHPTRLASRWQIQYFTGQKWLPDTTQLYATKKEAEEVAQEQRFEGAGMIAKLRVAEVRSNPADVEAESCVEHGSPGACVVGEVEIRLVKRSQRAQGAPYSGSGPPDDILVEVTHPAWKQLGEVMPDGTIEWPEPRKLSREVKTAVIGLLVGPPWSTQNTSCERFEERDELDVRLVDARGKEIVAFAGEDARDAFADGFLAADDLHGSLVAYANKLGAHAKKR